MSYPNVIQDINDLENTHSLDIESINSSVNDLETTKADKTELNNYLPLSGGTMNGIITIPSNGLRGNTTTGAIHIYAGTDYSNGAILRLCGNDNENPGEFSLWAGGNSTGCKRLHGKTDGTLTWNGNPICGVVQSKGGISWYRKYSDGWIEQGGYTMNITQNTTITYPLSFSSATSYCLHCVGFVIDGVGRQMVTSKSATGFTTGSNVKTSSTDSWYACGY